MYLNSRECSEVTGIAVRSLEAYRTNARFELDEGKVPAFIRNTQNRPVYDRVEVARWVKAEYRKAFETYSQRMRALAKYVPAKEVA